MKPLISVIVLTYNQEQTIGRTLDSILNQKTECSFEIIIGEDASPIDNTRLVCERYVEQYPHIIRLMPKTPNKGLLRNYADCIAVCQGKYIAVCAGDDWWHNPEKLQMQVDFMEANPDYGVVHTDFDMYNTINNKVTRSFNDSLGRNLPNGDIYADLLHGDFIVAGTVMYRKSTFDASVDLDEFIELGFAMEDYPTLLAMSQVSKIKYLDISTFSYVSSPGSICNSGADIERREHFESNVMNVKKYFYEKNPAAGLSNKIFLIDYYMTMVYQCMLFKKRKQATKNARQLLKLSPSIKNLAKFMICIIPNVFNRYHKYLQNK